MCNLVIWLQYHVLWLHTVALEVDIFDFLNVHENDLASYTQAQSLKSSILGVLCLLPVRPEILFLVAL